MNKALERAACIQGLRSASFSCCSTRADREELEDVDEARRGEERFGERVGAPVGAQGAGADTGADHNGDADARTRSLAHAAHTHSDASAVTRARGDASAVP
jgi:hypothetical protein